MVNHIKMHQQIRTKKQSPQEQMHNMFKRHNNEKKA